MDELGAFLTEQSSERDADFDEVYGQQLQLNKINEKNKKRRKEVSPFLKFPPPKKN